MLGVILFNGLVAGDTRIDQLLYGRYMENIMSVFLSIGFAYLSDTRKNIAKDLLSFMAVSGSPTISIPGSPALTSTSTSTT